MISINSSILRSKAIGFKQLSEIVQSQLKLKLALHKIKKIVEERVRKLSITFMEKLLLTADLDIDLSDRSSLLRSTLSYSLRESTKSFWRNQQSSIQSRNKSKEAGKHSKGSPPNNRVTLEPSKIIDYETNSIVSF